MTLAALTITAVQTDPFPSPTIGLRAITGMVLVLGLLCVLAWMARKGLLRVPGSRARMPVAIEATVPLGDRRSLLVVSVEGRRLLLGLTPVQVSFVTELAPPPSPLDFQGAVDRRISPPPSAS